MFKAIKPLTRKGALRDALAGCQLAAMNIPQALGYTKIAGMPVVTGFYTLLLPLVAFSAFGSSRYLVVSADSATAAILAGGLSHLAAMGSARYVALAGLVALLTAALLLIARFLKLGFLADFLSQTVLVGFLAGVGFQVAVAVSGEMLGLETHSRRTIGQLSEIVGGVPQMHALTVTLSAVIVVAVFALGRFAPRVPAPLIAVVGATLASAFGHFDARGVSIVGPVSGGLPRLGWPDVSWRDIETVLPVAASCFVMIVAQSAATARVYAGRHRQALDENADLAGLSAANAAASLTGAFVVNGSPTQTAMVESFGGQSQLAQIFTALVVALVLMFLTGPLRYLPHCALGALVFVVALKLIDWRALNGIRRESPGEYALALTAAAVVILVGVEQGILAAMVLSLLRVVQHSYRPHTGVLVRGDNGIWQSLPVAPHVLSEPGLVIYRFGAALFYANAGRFAQEVRALAGAASSGVRWVVVDAEAITQMDYTASHVILELKADLALRGIQLGFARVQYYLRSDMDPHHVTAAIGEDKIFAHLRDAVKSFEETARGV